MSRIYKVISLNIEGEKHLHRFTKFMRDESADIVFLQEVPQHLAREIGDAIAMRLLRYDAMAYAPHPYKEQDALNSVWGIACYARNEAEVLSNDAKYYRHECVWGHPEIKAFDAEADRMIQSVVMRSEGKVFTMLQTHFTWTDHGLPDARQEQDIKLLMNELSSIPQFALFGDFNAPRGRNHIWDIVARAYRDNIPVDIVTTLDTQLHRVGHLPRIVDMCFTTSALDVDSIKLISGLSDHQAVLALLHDSSMG